MELLNSHLLPDPVEKQNASFTRKYPFPIIRDGEKSELKIAEGYLKKDCVIVREEEDIKRLYTHGFFGKGTHSRSTPKICLNQQNHGSRVSTGAEAGTSGIQKDNGNPTGGDSPDPTKPDDIELIEVSDDSSDEEKNIKTEKKVDTDEVMEIVISDSDSSSDEEINVLTETSADKSEATHMSIKNKQPVKKKTYSNAEDPIEKECLQLTFEEAYFLSYALGCLVVKDDKNQFVNLVKLWNIFCDASPDKNFPAMYAAYHHFRSKLWIVKPGLKYGVDYILYKDGPPFYHATYSVLVKPVKEKGFRDMQNSRQMTWASLLALNRLNSAAGKHLLFCYVIKPTSLSENKVTTPLCISHFLIEEVLFRRWVPGENREAVELNGSDS